MAKFKCQRNTEIEMSNCSKSPLFILENDPKPKSVLIKKLINQSKEKL